MKDVVKRNSSGALGVVYAQARLVRSSMNKNDIGQFQQRCLAKSTSITNKLDFERGPSELGDLSEFPIKYRLFLKAYPWRHIGRVPWAALLKPLKDSRLVLISTAGLILPDQEPFDKSIRGGDCSFREIPSDADVSTLIDTHRSDLFDHVGVRQDPNLTFPIDRVRELEKKGAYEIQKTRI